MVEYTDLLVTTPVPFSVRLEGGHTLTFVRPADPDALLQSITEEQFAKDEFLPYWAEHWPCSDVLAHYLSAARFDRIRQMWTIGTDLDGFWSRKGII